MNTVQIMPAELAELITSCTHAVFSTMLGLEIASSGGALPSPPQASPTSGLIALIGLAGPWSGTGSLSCSGEFACRMASALLLSDCPALDEDVLDAVGEITNMIIGNVKTELEEKIGPMGLSTPTVIFGREFQTRSARIHQWTVVPFLCGTEYLYVQMCLVPSLGSEQGTLRYGLQVPQLLTS